jgi:hypothetical protein
VRLVLDTNVLISGFIEGRGHSGQLLALLRRHHFTLVTSDAQLAELRRVLGYERLQRFIQPEQADWFLKGLPHVAEVVSTIPEVDLSPDPDDNAIIATAIAGRADAIVSGDKRDLVRLKEAAGIAIITPREALERLQSKP